MISDVPLRNFDLMQACPKGLPPYRLSLSSSNLGLSLKSGHISIACRPSCRGAAPKNERIECKRNSRTHSILSILI